MIDGQQRGDVEEGVVDDNLHEVEYVCGSDGEFETGCNEADRRLDTVRAFKDHSKDPSTAGAS